MVWIVTSLVVLLITPDSYKSWMSLLESIKILQFPSKHLGIAQGFSGFMVYWIHMVIPNSGLSRTQLPKGYFYKQNGHISFLCLNSHIQNYKDSKLRTVANERLKEIGEVLKTNHSS